MAEGDREVLDNNTSAPIDVRLSSREEAISLEKTPLREVIATRVLDLFSLSLTGEASRGDRLDRQ
jgi:hypothetical protein